MAESSKSTTAEAAPGSGKTDIAVFYDQGDNQQSLWLISSEYNFQPRQVWEATGWARPQGVITGDFSGSGKTDIAAYPNSETGLWILPTQKPPSPEILRDSIPVPGRTIHPIGMELRR